MSSLNPTVTKDGKHQRNPESPDVEWEIWVENLLGIHARPAAQIMALAGQFNATVILEKDGFQANAPRQDRPPGSRDPRRAKP